MGQRQDIVIRLGGEGGEGVISAGEILTLGATRSGYQVFTFRTYPSEMKGGHAWYQMRVSPDRVRSMGDQADVLVAFDDTTYETHLGDLQSHGVLVYDPDALTPHPDPDIVAYPVPFSRIARRQLGFPRGKNVVIVGAIAALLGLEPSSLQGLVEERFKRHPEAAKKNLEALQAGYEYVHNHTHKKDPFSLGHVTPADLVVMNGNASVVAGALAAGCRFFAGYPITPASEVLEEMARTMPRIGGVCLQAEDEIASIGAVLGASYAGAKAMTATSGPGLSLMTEFISWSGMAEVPCVIVNVQRGGPSTGLPTKLEQADLNHAIFGGHGDFPRIVLAAGSVEDAFYQTINAFNLSEKYQVPVILLSDQSLSHRTEAMHMTDSAHLLLTERVKPTGDSLSNGYKRYAITPAGVSPMSVPGMSGGGYIATGLEHDEAGNVDRLTASHVLMMPKRARKLETAMDDLPASVHYGHDKADVGVISWGSTEGSVREAVEEAVDGGISVAGLHLRTLYPLDAGPIKEFISSVKRVVVPELNYSGQLADYLGSRLSIQPIRLNKYSGVPFTAQEICRKLQEVTRDL